MSDSELVREFTRAAGQPVPNVPEKMSSEEVFFLAKMMLDEIMEMCASVSNSEQYKVKLINIISEARDYNVPYETMSDSEIIAEQVDAMNDCYYYSLNALAKKGVNFSKVFKLVHEANMKKRDPETGAFLKRADGKIIKPIGWSAPNITQEIEDQMKNGSFIESMSVSDEMWKCS